MAPTRPTGRRRRVSAKRHPSLWSIAQHLREIAQLLDDHGHHDRAAATAERCTCLPCAARLLAARGWPTATISDGTGSRSSDATSSTERAIGLGGNERKPLTPPLPMFTGVDERLSKQLYVMWQVGLNLQADIRNVLAHGDKEDMLPAGSGECGRCARFCRPDQKTGDRIVSGYCPTCHRLWLRRGRPDRSAFSREGNTTEEAA